MSATTADLEKLIKQSTPRVEDVRTVDRCDIIRREHGHKNLREVVSSLDALEFSIDSFLCCMQQIQKAGAQGTGDAASAPEPTAIHGLLRCVNGLQLNTEALKKAEEAVAEADTCQAATEAKEGWQEAAAEAKKAGGECFKNKDVANALTHYSTAIQATPDKDESLSALYSNRSACLLQLDRAAAALADAEKCVELTPQWPKGHFRRGSCLRQLDRLTEAAAAFRDGQIIEPVNKDWEREIDKTERLHRALPHTQARQLAFTLIPEILTAWVRAGANGGVIHIQVNGELESLGTPKWQLARDKKEPAKAQMRFCFLDEKGYMANLAANLQSSPEGVGVVDLNGKALKIADVKTFLEAGDSAKSSPIFHMDVKHNGKMVAVIGRLAADEEVRRFVPDHKDPPAPKGTVEGALQAQARTGFSKALPRLLGFMSFPGGDLNFPVIDLDRDCPGAVPVAKQA